MNSPKTVSLPKALAARAAHTELSIPPDSPTTTPFFFSTPITCSRRVALICSTPDLASTCRTSAENVTWVSSLLQRETETLEAYTKWPSGEVTEGSNCRPSEPLQSIYVHPRPCPMHPFLGESLERALAACKTEGVS